MTLQQKMLAKQSKKGFTLVELVVVIAILAILAAIAIPAVIGIINSASQSAGASDASTLNNACKTVYAGVKSGSITTESKDNNGSNCTWAAAPGASNSDRLTKAKAVKLSEVQAYNGTALALGTNGDYYYAKATQSGPSKGTIVYWDGSGTKNPGADEKLTNDTTLGTLYGETAAKP